MRDLIEKAFMHVDFLAEHVQRGHYDISSPDGEIILPSVWETMIKPGWKVSMVMWQLDEASHHPPNHSRLRQKSELHKNSIVPCPPIETPQLPPIPLNSSFVDLEDSNKSSNASHISMARENQSIFTADERKSKLRSIFSRKKRPESWFSTSSI